MMGTNRNASLSEAKHEHESLEGKDRRTLLAGVGAVMAVAAGTACRSRAPSSALAQNDRHSGHVGHGGNHGGGGEGMPHRYLDVVESTKNCIAAGEICVAHCARLLGQGDTSLADCNRTVHDMLALCTAMQKLAAYSSDLAPGIAAACITACRVCKEACEAHARHHVACRDCFEACKECEKVCRRTFRA